jgi:hypothetical protein
MVIVKEEASLLYALSIKSNIFGFNNLLRLRRQTSAVVSNIVRTFA